MSITTADRSPDTPESDMSGCSSRRPAFGRATPLAPFVEKMYVPGARMIAAHAVRRIENKAGDRHAVNACDLRHRQPERETVDVAAH